MKINRVCSWQFTFYNLNVHQRFSFFDNSSFCICHHQDTGHLANEIYVIREPPIHSVQRSEDSVLFSQLLLLGWSVNQCIRMFAQSTFAEWCRSLYTLINLFYLQWKPAKIIFICFPSEANIQSNQRANRKLILLSTNWMGDTRWSKGNLEIVQHQANSLSVNHLVFAVSLAVTLDDILKISEANSSTEPV